jgi:predicted site-specific integrase-resolvase
MKANPQFITRKQLAERWDVSIESLKRYERRGILRPVKIAPRVLRYAFEEIEAREREATLDRKEVTA